MPFGHANKREKERKGSKKCDQIRMYWTLGHFLKTLATIIFLKLPPFLGNFCKGVKIYHFLLKSFLTTFIDIWRFFLVTLVVNQIFVTSTCEPKRAHIQVIPSQRDCLTLIQKDLLNFPGDSGIKLLAKSSALGGIINVAKIADDKNLVDPPPPFPFCFHVLRAIAS